MPTQGRYHTSADIDGVILHTSAVQQCCNDTVLHPDLRSANTTQAQNGSNSYHIHLLLLITHLTPWQSAQLADNAIYTIPVQLLQNKSLNVSMKTGTLVNYSSEALRRLACVNSVVDQLLQVKW